MSLFNSAELLILNLILGTSALWANVYIGLSSTTPADDGTNITEPSGGSYARVAKATNATNFPAAALVGGLGTISNGTIITFPTATADWLAGVNLTHVVIFDALTAGNPILWHALTTPKPVFNGDPSHFAIGALKFTAD